MKDKLKQHQKKLTIIIGLAITVAMLYWSTRGVDWRKCGSDFKAYRWLWMLPAFATFYYSMYLRAVRWKLFFADKHGLTGYRLFPPLMVGFCFNSILPMRVGEFMRSYLVGTRLKTGVATTMATVGAERIMDGVTMLAMMAISLIMMPPIDPAFSITEGNFTLTAANVEAGKKGLIIVCLVLTVGVITYMLPWTQRLIYAIIRKFPMLSDRLKEKLLHFVEAFTRGFDSLKDPVRVVKMLAYSIVLWGLVGVSNVAVARGFGVEMSLPQAITMVTLIGIFITIPASPGYWGLYEAGGIFSLFVLGVLDQSQRTLAFSVTLMTHLLQYLPIVVIGLFYAVRMGVKPNQAQDVEELVEESVEANTHEA